MPEPVIYSVDDVSDEDADVLRKKFLQRVQQDDLKELVDPVDIRRTKTDPLWCKRFLAHGDLDMKKALNFMIDSVKFRKEMAVNEMSLKTVDNTLFDKGVMCIHGRDKDGCVIAIFNARLHERTSGPRFEEVKKFLVFWVEKLERQERGKRITMFFDMGNAGLSNVDIPFIAYLINLFKLYYPDMLNAIIVFELPFIMNAAWKIVKNMLPAKSHQLIKFASKKDVSSLVSADSCLVRWGGSDTWAYSFDPEECAMPESPFLGDQPADDGPADDINGVANGHDGPPRASDRARGGRKTSQGHQAAANFHSVRDPRPTSQAGHKVHFPDEVSVTSDELSDGRAVEETSTADLGGLFEISPGEEIWFGSGATGAKRALTLVNTRGAPVAFKVKTTSPEKFRVRPSSGIVPTGQRLRVELQLCDGVTPQHVITDRFLIVAAGVPHERVPSRDMGRLWRSLPSEDKLEHCLRCAAAPALNDPLMALVKGLGSRLETVSQRLERQQQLLSEAEQRHGSARRRALVAMAVVTAMTAANLYLTLTASRC